MKTISTHLNINNHELNQPITTKKSYRNYKYYQNYNHAAGDINRNATISQVECQRDACEEELYRLRYGIEKLLANNQHGDFRERQRQRFGHVQNPFKTMTNKITDFTNRKNKNWLDQCSPCCRRWRRYICDDNVNTPNEYNDRPIYNDRNDDLPSRRTHESPPQSQLHSQSFISTSPSPSISRQYIDPNIRDTNSDLGRSIDLLTSKDINDPVYNSLILKILEAKALDCLCTGYSKQNTQKQISQALTQINQRIDEHPWDSVSATSSRSLPASNEASSSDSSILTNDESISSPSITPQIYSPSPSISERHSLDQTIPSRKSPDESSLRLNEDIKSPKKKSKARSLADKRSQSNKSKRKKKPSSKHRKQSRKKPGKSKTSRRKPSKSKTSRRKPGKSKTSRIKPGKSKTSRKKPGKSKKSRKKPGKSKTSRKKTGKSKKSRKRPSSSKSRKKKGSSRSPSRSKTSRKHKSKHKKSSRKKRKKRTKEKSNNQVNDYETVLSPTFIYPQSYQEVYRNRQRLLST